MANIAYFLDLELDTENTTFHPRPETEILVEKAIELAAEEGGPNSAWNILDIGTGCGNIAISLTKYIPLSRIVALDISDDVLRVARRNAAKYNIADRIEFIKSDIFKGIKHEVRFFFDLIISNPPYVSLEDFSSLSAEVKKDPYIALYGGRDGMDFYRRIDKAAPYFLKRNGILLMEIGHDQASSVKAMLVASGNFHNIEVYKDYSGIDRTVKAVYDG